MEWGTHKEEFYIYPVDFGSIGINKTYLDADERTGNELKKKYNINLKSNEVNNFLEGSNDKNFYTDSNYTKNTIDKLKDNCLDVYHSNCKIRLSKFKNKLLDEINPFQFKVKANKRIFDWQFKFNNLFQFNDLAGLYKYQYESIKTDFSVLECNSNLNNFKEPPNLIINL